MADVQQPVFIQGYGHILCTREFFKKVPLRAKKIYDFKFHMKRCNTCFFFQQTINGGFSYFMTLKEIHKFKWENGRILNLLSFELILFLWMKN